MGFLLSFWRSTIGKKAVMAVTGLIGVGFVIGHMLGNLQMFQGAEKMNAYAHFLKSLGGLLWLARLILIAALVLHVVAAYQLTRMRAAARPVGYKHGSQREVSTLASRTMRWGGVLVLVFIVFHILHFTTLDIFPSYSATDVYGNVIHGFSIWWVTLFYVVAMVFLGLHLYHGAWSSFRTLGATKMSAHPLRRTVALWVAIIVWAGFTAIPVAVFMGLIGPEHVASTTRVEPATASVAK
ncbi:MAG TPA: succinate dehydrogenase cytochrome b subunit [Gemmatimonadaceae bacterium]|nr:succinate dehydrogenase cytochrome b subunit [Gemmatimonadaceae bacterium]